MSERDRARGVAKRGVSLERPLRGSILLTFAVLATSCATRREPALPLAPPAALGLSEASLARMDSALAAFVDSGHVAGIYAVIARHGRIGYERTFGRRDLETGAPMRREAVFRVYSMTKPVVAAGILRLVDEGRLGLDDPVATYIPTFADVRVFAGGSADAPVLEVPSSPVTVRQLLNHTSGLAYGLTPGPVDTIFGRAKLYDASRTLQEFTDRVARIPLLFAPGTDWSYGSGFEVAGRVIEVVSGEPLDRFLEDRIFRPLGMRDTGFRVRPGMRDRLATVYRTGPDGSLEPLGRDGLMSMFEPEARFLWASGGLLSTPDDYLRFAHMLLGGGVFDGTRVLTSEAVELMTRNTLPPDRTPIAYGSLTRDHGYGFGLGVAVKVDSADVDRAGPAGVYRWSGYVGTYFWVDPSNDLVAMVWTQHSPGARHPIQTTFQELVYSALRW